MTFNIRTYLLLAALCASSKFLSNADDSSAEECGDVQHNVDNGMIRLPDFSGESIRDLNCSWTYTAPPGRKLLVKVDNVHLPPLDLRSSVFHLYIDDELYDIPRNCVKCLREMVAGKVIKVLFVSYLTSNSESSNSTEMISSSATEGIGSFQVRYKSFDPHRCNKPETLENGYLVSKGRKLGHDVFYHCNPPYELIGEAESTCIVPDHSPVPEWSNKAPECVIHECNDGPIVRQAGSGSIASPGYPSYIYQFTSPCQWEIVANPSHQIKVSITFLKFPQSQTNMLSNDTSSLSLFDGDLNNLIVNITESISDNSLNFTTLSNKLIVIFTVGEDSKRKEETGVFLDYSVVSSSCPVPAAPENGEVIAHSNYLGSTVAYRCLQGYVLVGELHSECLLNGKWSHPTPACEPLSVSSPQFIASSNDSDTVSAKLDEFPIVTDSSSSVKPSKNSRKKAKSAVAIKTSTNLSDFEEKPSISKDHFSEFYPVLEGNDKVADSKIGKKLDKENGPKSEPHLLQVIPPKDLGKKASTDSEQVLTDTSRVSKPGNATRNQEQIPVLGTGYNDGKGPKKPFFTVTMIAIIAGVGAPLAIGIILLIIVTIYRRRYPVRMQFGRKFSTFENPMYVTKDAQHPRELKRLTT